MKPLARYLALIMTVGFGLPVATFASAEETQAAYILALGRNATAPEQAQAGGLPATLDHLQNQLKTTANQRQTVAARAARFVYGDASVAPNQPAARDALFATQVGTHLAELAENEAAYLAVLQRVYPYVVGRDIYTEEIEYWAGHPTLPYALLVGCVEDWARRNQPGLMNTAGTPTVSVNCELLETQRLSPELANQVAAVMGLPAATTVLAAGGDSLKSSGDIRFLVIETR